jgi:transmembrane 9 superfamily protein 3
VNLTSENPVTLSAGTQLDFTYSVDWAPSSTPFHRRFDRYLDYDFFEHQVRGAVERAAAPPPPDPRLSGSAPAPLGVPRLAQIHWFSIFNSFMMVIFLTGIVSLILMRTLRKDYAKYARETGDLDDLDQELDESGWKQVHGDVFRAPPNLTLFCALVGTGSQLATMVFLMILFATATTLYMGRGAMLYTAGLFPGLCLALTLVLNSVALMYKSLAAVPFTSILMVLLIWVFLAVPLCIIGTILGRNWSGAADFPCRVNAIPRLIPDKRWYARPPVLICLGGVLPFGSIFIEMYFVFTSFWNYKFYYVYGFMFLVYVILTIVTICVTIVVTYFLLNNEDYRWPWTSFAASCSTAGYVFLYSVYYFFVKTKMSGFFQTVFYFGYSAPAPRRAQRTRAARPALRAPSCGLLAPRYGPGCLL